MELPKKQAGKLEKWWLLDRKDVFSLFDSRTYDEKKKFLDIAINDKICFPIK